MTRADELKAIHDAAATIAVRAAFDAAKAACDAEDAWDNYVACKKELENVKD